MPIREVVAGGDVTQAAYVDLERGRAVNSTTPDGTFSIDGLPAAEAIERITAWLEQTGKGRKAINYKLRDWLFSRQRYWGEPLPIVLIDGQPVAIPEEQLPLRLPHTDQFKLTEAGEEPEPPLGRIREWVATHDPRSGKGATRGPTRCRSGPARAGTV